MLNLDYQRDKIFESKKHIIEDLFKGDRDILIFGITNYTEPLINFLKEKGLIIKGIIDDYTEKERIFDIKILRSDQIDKNNIVISSIIEGRPKSVRNLLLNKGVNDLLDYFDFNYMYPNLFQIPFNSGNREKILNNQSELQFVADKLQDDLSKKFFQEVIDFRLNFNYWNKCFIYSPENQYFELFFNFENIFSFIDAGGYDGETTLNAFNKFRNLNKVIFIEPFPESMKLAKEKMSVLHNDKISFIETAISDHNTVKYITTHKGNANHLIDYGELTIRVSKLDEIVNEKIDFIKLDIEGEELKALKGAENLIKKFKPYIACCVYHDQNHFWQIPLFLLKINPGYKIYFSHYTEGICESVMYFI
ncbi:MAG: hypothetical protein KatS3mg096_895 [Candidatus Parcubacteria bacterium]|nr:MAG: hypothetical protein KatS3mg096_895 [Candidatus Parcubacteria bacterium]